MPNKYRLPPSRMPADPVVAPMSESQTVDHEGMPLGAERVICSEAGRVTSLALNMPNKYRLPPSRMPADPVGGDVFFVSNISPDIA